VIVEAGDQVIRCIRILGDRRFVGGLAPALEIWMGKGGAVLVDSDVRAAVLRTGILQAGPETAKGLIGLYACRSGAQLEIGEAGEESLLQLGEVVVGKGLDGQRPGRSGGEDERQDGKDGDQPAPEDHDAVTGTGKPFWVAQ